MKAQNVPPRSLWSSGRAWRYRGGISPKKGTSSSCAKTNRPVSQWRTDHREDPGGVRRRRPFPRRRPKEPVDTEKEGRVPVKIDRRGFLRSLVGLPALPALSAVIAASAVASPGLSEPLLALTALDKKLMALQDWRPGFPDNFFLASPVLHRIRPVDKQAAFSP